MNINSFEPIRSGDYSVPRTTKSGGKKNSSVSDSSGSAASESVSKLLKGLSPKTSASQNKSLSEIQTKLQAGGYQTREAAELVADSILREV